MKILLLLMFLGICHAAPFSSPCTKEEMLKAMTEFEKLIEDLKSPHVDFYRKLEEIEQHIEKADDYHTLIQESCGEEKLMVDDEYSAFIKTAYFVPLEFMIDIVTDDYDDAKDVLQNITHTHTLQHFVIRSFTMLRKLDYIIEVVKLMDEPKATNTVHEALIWTLNSTNIQNGKLLLPLLKDHIDASKNNADEEILKAAKLNLQELAERTVSYYPDALVALNEIDSKMAEETVEDIVKHVFVNSAFSKSFDIINNIPIVHLKCVALQALQEKVVSMNLLNSLVETKIAAIANSIKPAAIKENNVGDLEIIVNLVAILENFSSFNYRLYSGQICRSFGDIEGSNVEKDYEYFLLGNREDKNVDHEDVYKIKENGNVLRINVETNGIKHFFTLKNGEYPEDIDMAGTIISKQELVMGDVTEEQFCELKESVEYNVCIPMADYLFLFHDEALSVAKESYKYTAMKILLILMLLGVCHGAPSGTTCISEILLRPIAVFKERVEELKAEGVDQEKKLQEIYNILDEAENYVDTVNKTCNVDDSVEEVEAIIELTNFYLIFLGPAHIDRETITDDYNAAKKLFEEADSKHTLQFYVTKSSFILEGLDKIIDVVKLMDNPKKINNVHEAIIYSINSTNKDVGKLLIPIIKDHIASNENNVDKDIVKDAMLNLKLLTERTISYYPDALVGLNEVDSKMAIQAIQDIVKHKFTNSIFSKSFDIINSIPINKVKGLALKALYEKAISMNLENSLVTTKILMLADETFRKIPKEEINENDLEVAEPFAGNRSNFNFRLFMGKICRSFDDLESNESNVKKNYEYFLFENPQELTDLDSEDVQKVKENGNLLRINVETNGMNYFFIIKNDEYPENINLSGTITSKQELGGGDVTAAQFCEIRESIEYSICIPLSEYILLSFDEAVALKETSYKTMKEYNSKSLFSECS